MASEATRFTLVHCMRKLLRQQSFSKITIDDLCKAAHISRRSFYRYFPDKYSLLATTYQKCFFSKIQVKADSLFWDLFEEICIQMYAEKEFFHHAFEVKGQNGFWEETHRLLTPYMERDYPVDAKANKRFQFFVSHTIDMLFELMEKWIQSVVPLSPIEFADSVRCSFAIYGKWLYEAATNQPRTVFSSDKRIE